jgi:hypothetical protein
LQDIKRVIDTNITGAALGSNKMRKDDKGNLAADKDRIRKNRYREEMAEDAPPRIHPKTILRCLHAP